MTHILQVLAALMTTSASIEGLSLVDKFGRGITKEIVAVKTPVIQTITYVGSSQCSNVKRIAGIEYDQLKGFSEPDLNQLTLHFTTRTANQIFNITQAPELITAARGFDPNKKLIIFIHGFTDDPTKNSFQNISGAFLSQADCNVLALDGSSLIRWLYLRSTTYIRFMGEKLGAVLHAMVKSGLNPASIHLIGHSLGSHIAGFAGKTFFNMTGSRVGRISGLDPAGPCFTHVDPELRLMQSDADFVDVIHTDIGVYGLSDAVGHVDFYPNGGSHQPNCLFQTCGHSRAWLLYSESIVKPDAFPAVSCKDWDAFRIAECGSEIKLMGYACSPDTRGVYFLRTGEDPPYGLGKEGIVYKNNEGFIRSFGAAGAAVIG